MTGKRGGPQSIGVFTGMVAMAAMSIAPAQAGEFEWGGFASVVAGAVIDSDNPPDELYANPEYDDCPCAITDWSNAGIYEGSHWTLKPDTKIGLQASYYFNDTWSTTAQIVSRGTDTDPDLDWAYVSVQLSDSVKLDLGRKRIPLYFYSDFQDVGYAYPWITPPDELYGWEHTNYNGGSISYSFGGDGAHIITSIFAGWDDVNDNPYMETWNDVKADTEWNDMIGWDVEVSKDWWTFRFVYVRANASFTYDDPDYDYDENVEALGVAFNADWGRVFMLSEAGDNRRINEDDGDYYNYHALAYSVGLGYRLTDDWILFANYSNYKEIYDYDEDAYRYNTSSLTVRYNFYEGMAVKVQFDLMDDDSDKDAGDSVFTESYQLLRVSYDVVF